MRGGAAMEGAATLATLLELTVVSPQPSARQTHGRHQVSLPLASALPAPIDTRRGEARRGEARERAERGEAVVTWVCKENGRGLGDF
ncbi:hypothetical protein E2C01_051351 [Portunus trituberculatus]|uniref:Uncharacterized protein n=1 Tax=Portunus trituberculatus TaxID=210409 RepID=A0A5B7GEI1_PORTR|nr:hypothetical protein [Portunus trituberculatus]